MLIVGKQYSFSASHHLPDHNGKCRRDHGHNYDVEIEVQGQSLEGSGSSAGMLIDFGDLDLVVGPLVEELDHYDLNEVLFGVSYQPPTAEHIALWFRDHIDRHLPVGITLRRVKVWETKKCWAEWHA